MAPLDQYVEAVKLLLPASRRDALGRELSAMLRARIDARAQELGRPLTDAEQAAILHRHGHPMDVAARYRTRPHVIGPAMLPIYLLTLKLGLGVALVVTAVAAIMDAFDPNPLPRVIDGLIAFPGRALHVVVWTTAAFAALEVANRRFDFARRWPPASLLAAGESTAPSSRAGAIAAALLGTAGVAWLILVPRMPSLLLGPAAAWIEPAYVWRAAYVPILLVFIVSAALEFARVASPRPTPLRSYARLGLNAASFVVVVTLLNAGALFVAAPAGDWPSGVNGDQLARAIGAGVRAGLTIWAVVSVIEMVREAIWLKTHRPAAAAPPSPPGA